MTELRRSLVPSLLEVVLRNHRRGAEGFRFYEIDRAFSLLEGEPDASASGSTGGLTPPRSPVESWSAAMILGGPARELAWRNGSEESDFYHLKGAVDSLLESLGIRDTVYAPATPPGPPLVRGGINAFVDGKTAVISCGDETLGIIGQIAPALTTKSKLRTPIFAAELNLHALLPNYTAIRLHGGLPRTQAVDKDISVLLPVDTPYGDVVNSIRTSFETTAKTVQAAFLETADEEQREAAQGPRLEDVRCVDFYRGKGVADDRKSLTIRMTFRDTGRTLTSEESNTLLQAAADALAKEHNAELRG